MLKTTITLAGNYGTSPFAMFEQDVDEMIMLVNYYIDLGANAHQKEKNTAPAMDDGFWNF